MTQGIENITVWLQESFSLHVVILIWAILYFLLDIVLKRISVKQKDRKKQANARIDELKQPWLALPVIMEEKEKTISKTEKMWGKYDAVARMLTNENKWASFKKGFAELIADNRWVEALRLEKHMSNEEIEQFQKESKRIIKEEKSYAMIPILFFAGKLTLFILLLRTFALSQEIPYSQTLVIMTTIVSFFAVVTRKTMVIFLLFAVLSFIFYQYLSGAALFFLLAYWAHKGIQFRSKQWWEYRKKQKKYEEKEDAE